MNYNSQKGVPPSPILPLAGLSATQGKHLKAAASSWLDYYYRPLLFPDEYFKHFVADNRYRTLKKHVLYSLYPTFKEIFLLRIDNTNTFNTYIEFRRNPGRTAAQKLFSEFYYFVDYAYQYNPSMQQLRNATRIPLAGKLISVYTNATSKDMRQKAEKVRIFLNDLFLIDYENWLETLGETNE